MLILNMALAHIIVATRTKQCVRYTRDYIYHNSVSYTNNGSDRKVLYSGQVAHGAGAYLRFL